MPALSNPDHIEGEISVEKLTMDVGHLPARRSSLGPDCAISTISSSVLNLLIICYQYFSVLKAVQE